MVNRIAILQPMFALAAWTLCVLSLVAYRRIAGTGGTRVHPNEYALGESSKVPAAAVLANRNYMNLLELPILFYIGCLTAFVTDAVTSNMVMLAWTYVGLRVVHTFVHVTYNRILHRFLAFLVSNVVLAWLWVLIASRVLG